MQWDAAGPDFSCSNLAEHAMQEKAALLTLYTVPLPAEDEIRPKVSLGMASPP
jgi:hypothetical protein